VKEVEFSWGSDRQVNKKVYFRVKFEDWKLKPGKLVKKDLCVEEENFIRTYLQVDSIEEDVEFWYGIFGE
jgi:hypothetical protein